MGGAATGPDELLQATQVVPPAIAAQIVAVDGGHEADVLEGEARAPFPVRRQAKDELRADPFVPVGERSARTA